MDICYAPTDYFRLPRPLVFLGGSIEQGQADPWQDEVVEAMAPYKGTLLNPRRLDWDPDQEQSASNPYFRKQVEWELRALEEAQAIVMYFDPKTKSPVSLLELGLYAKSGKLIVACPEGFWRKGNVDIVCEKHQIEVLPDLEALIDTLDRGMEARARVQSF